MSESFIMYFITLLLLTSLTLCVISTNLIHTVFWLTSSFTSGSLLLISVNLYFIGFVVMLIYLGAIAILFVFGVMLVDNNKKEALLAERGTIPFLVITCMFTSLAFTESLSSVSETTFGPCPNYTSELLNIGFAMYNYLGNSLLISFLMLCVPMVAIMLFVGN